jgi:hypothetical protein
MKIIAQFDSVFYFSMLHKVLNGQLKIQHTRKRINITKHLINIL